MVYILNPYVDLFEDLFYLFLIITLGPLVIQVLIYLFLGMVENILGLDIEPLVNLLVLPGSMVRVMIHIIILRMVGYKVQLTYHLPRPGRAAGNLSRYRNDYHAFNYSVRRSSDSIKNYDDIEGIRKILDRERITFKVTLLMTFSSYLTFILGFLAVSYYPIFSAFFRYSIGNGWGGILAIYLIFSLLVGGIPVPQETMVSFYYLIYMQPEHVLSLLAGLFAAGIVSNWISMTMGKLLISIIVAYNIILLYYYEAKIKDAQDSDLTLLQEATKGNMTR